MSEITFIKNYDEMRAHPVFQRVKDLCDQYGYELHILANEVYSYGGNYAKLHMAGKIENKYAPHIYLTDVAAFKTGAQDWQYHIDTVSHGALTFEEYKKFLKATADAYELAKQLKEINIADWPQIDKRDKQ